MSRSGGQNSYDDIHMEILDDQRRWREGRRPDSMSLEHGVQLRAQTINRPHLSRGATQYQFNPHTSNRSLTQPRRSFLLKRQNIIHDLPSRNMGDMPGEVVTSAPLVSSRGQVSEEHHAAQIVSEMEKDTALMEDNPLSEQLRMETLREMPESLTMKRTIKKKLVKSVSQKSKRTPLSIWKRFKYRLSMSLTKFNIAVKNLLYTLELWYSSLKRIEGHFGSGVASYFRFLRWLFLLNTFVFFISFCFVVLPQLLYRFLEFVETNPETNSFTSGTIELHEESNTSVRLVTPLPVTTEKLNSASNAPQIQSRYQPYASNADFGIGNVFTGEGFFTDTTLFYGYYTNESVSLIPELLYQMSPAYFFTIMSCYLFMFIVLSVSMARSYRRTFIETAGDLKNVFAHKVFCGWDFSIATNEAAALKSKSIYNELTELLEDEEKDEEDLSCQDRCALLLIRMVLNVFVVFVLAGTGLLMWFLLKEEMGVDSSGAEHSGTLVMPLIITVIMMISPILFSWVARRELFTNLRTSLFVTLIRTFLMEVVVIGVVVAFWLTYKKNSECWETSLGQEVYRLVIIDFLLVVVGTSLAEFLRLLIYKSVYKSIGAPEFDIARNTLNLLYNQTLFFVGFYFSPLIAFIIVLKLFITFYIKKYGVLKNCQPTARPWRAAQTQTLFLVLCFLASFVVLILLGYIITQVASSECGPFRTYLYPYEIILDVFNVDRENGFLTVMNLLLKPGVTAGILLALCVGVYYLRAKSHAHRRMVDILREMLVLEAKDKEFLLRSISRVTEGQWIYNLKNERHSSPEQHGKKTENLDSTSSSGASGGGEHLTHASSSYSDSLTDSDGLGHGDGGRVRVGYKVLPNRQQPSNTSVFGVSSSDEFLSGRDYSDMSFHEQDYRKKGGLRERRY